LDTPLPDSLYDGEGELLMRRGTMMTATKLKALVAKGLRYLELGEPSPAGNKEAAVATLDPPEASATTDDAESRHIEKKDASDSIRSDRFSPATTTKSNIRPVDPKTCERVNQLVSRAAETVEELGKSLAEGTLRDAEPIRNVANEFLKEVHGDMDTVVATILTQVEDEELAIRSVQLSVLSMAIARAMKLTDAEQATAGSAALLHDMALFELPPAERHSQAVMRPESRRIYESHPAIAYDMLERVRDIDGTVRIIVLQVHEQADGSGFPRRITITRTHRLARVVNLADAYLTLVSCHTACQGILPADAIAYLMHHSCMGRFDSNATCGLVRAVSLFPVGSLVKLSDDRIAKVVRVAPANPITPIVMAIDSDQSNSLIDLADSTVTIVHPVDDDTHGRRRLPACDLDKILW
jgi:HD-GYP domain-containing protein (c-di-GMP phosphodiesterase class II)